MRIKITGKTDSIITLNTLKSILQGKVSGLYDITTPAQENEIKILQRSNLIMVDDLEQTPTEKELPIISQPKNIEKPEETVETELEKLHGGKRMKSGRPKGSKNKKTVLPQSAQKKAKEAEAITQEMGSETVISTGGENKRVRMKRSFAGEIAESEQTQESLKAMEKITAEENGEEVEDKPTIDEEKLDPSEQVGRNAVISDMGKPTAQKMKNSILPEADKIKDKDPFIDRNNGGDDTADSFIDMPASSNDPSDAFIDAPQKAEVDDKGDDEGDEDFIEK